MAISRPWSGLLITPGAQTFTGSDYVVGLQGGSVNVAFRASSFALAANNLSDLANAGTARTNLGIDLALYMLKSNNLSDVASVATSQGNLGVIIAAGSGGNDTLSAVGGHTPVATGQYDFVFGFDCSASANYAFAFGNTCAAAGLGSFAFGTTCTATGTYTSAFGLSCTATGNYSYARGNAAVATNAGAVVWGDSNATPNVDTAADQFNLTFGNGYRLFGGSVNVNTAGQGLAVAEGSNAKQGVVTLSSGVGVVSNTSVTANSRIMYCAQDTDTIGFLAITARTASSGFTITSSVLTDSGVVAYEIFEPAA